MSILKTNIITAKGYLKYDIANVDTMLKDAGFGYSDISGIHHEIGVCNACMKNGTTFVTPIKNVSMDEALSAAYDTIECLINKALPQEELGSNPALTLGIMIHITIIEIGAEIFINNEDM